ncbi:YciI family protein [Streptomyces spiralis]
MASEPVMPWQQLIRDGRERGFLTKPLYAVFSTPVNGLGPVLEVLDEHAAFQVKLEEDGIMFVAGPLADDTEERWDGEGFFVYRASSRDEAIRIAEEDPMHRSGARTFRVRPWLLNEGSFRTRINYSTGHAQIL